MSYIQVNDLVKRYNGNLAVDNLTIAIEKGELFGLLGPNGAGKSTTIKVIMGLLQPTNGDIVVAGLDIRTHSLEAKQLIGFVPQEIAIYENLSARENVEFFGSLYGLKGKILGERSVEALEFVGLKDKANARPKTFSGGMKRRLNIACALVHQPPILIMDEPTVGIDPQSRNHILESVRELNRQGTTIIYTSHYMEEVEALCPRVGIMDHGRLIACGDKDSLENRIASGEKIVIQVDGDSAVFVRELEAIPAVNIVNLANDVLTVVTLRAQDSLQDILFILARNDIKVKNISIHEPNLESLFLELTGKNLRD